MRPFKGGQVGQERHARQRAAVNRFGPRCAVRAAKAWPIAGPIEDAVCRSERWPRRLSVLAACRTGKPAATNPVLSPVEGGSGH